MAHDPASLANLTGLLAGTAGATASSAVPSPDSLVHALAARYRLDLTATYAGDQTLVVVNPNEAKADVSEASKAEYEDRAYRVRSSPGGDSVHPHAYDLACRVYYAARRTAESQSIVYRCSPSSEPFPTSADHLSPRASQRSIGCRIHVTRASRHGAALATVDFRQEGHAPR